ncbi:hypothetical protein jhhlp_004548 [Lomentospora prolificans]|uniref:Uncharacterized protein n=1 Tax=Lomentospora prolificans TaxID=41688 RepID=A0A2N3NBV6_9PEZI|nr:hypothetical protein jhhlp_004548 [Lomentospora prolificans]
MAPYLSTTLGLALLLTVRVRAACTCVGIDYTNAGSYFIDDTLDENFSFISEFRDCESADITPILVAPDGAEHTCSVLDSGNDEMESGQWTIIIQGDDFDASFQRKFQLKPTAPEKTVVTVTPTVTVEITSTPPVKTKTDTYWVTVTRRDHQSPVTTQCSQSTQVVTNYVAGPTEIVSTTVERWSEREALTEYVRTTKVEWAYCHYPEGERTPAPDERPNVPEPQPGDNCGGECQPRWEDVPRDLIERDVAAAAAAAAITSTVSASKTVTSTHIVTKDQRTATESVWSTTTKNLILPAQTVCENTGVLTLTTVIRGEPATELRATYITHWVTPVVTASETVYVTSTDKAQETQCWQAGGQYGT